MYIYIYTYLSWSPVSCDGPDPPRRVLEASAESVTMFLLAALRGSEIWDSAMEKSLRGNI